MPVACRFSANVIAFLQLRVPVREARNETALAVRFRTNFQQRLAESHVERQLRGDEIGERRAAVLFKGRGILVIENVMAFFVKLYDLFGNAGIYP